MPAEGRSAPDGFGRVTGTGVTGTGVAGAGVPITPLRARAVVRRALEPIAERPPSLTGPVTRLSVRVRMPAGGGELALAAAIRDVLRDALRDALRDGERVR